MEKGDVPLGFGFALAQDPGAMERFAALTEAERQAYLDKARAVSSKGEMQALVSQLSARN
ncbi:hypothetical protein [Pseudoflavonifractor phocaeensis]|uniref:hypothetical protein n=1 Tax=Pseudoflavonifractor phocaeensis TaxID=1870988 RepID=UPI001F425B72|nr:hypothetical protein [Pseudoflavonifractor phocaeensis]MCF2661839.1 hypothetical protein [Pseudoflavonifractor phocaeensis]